MSSAAERPWVVIPTYNERLTVPELIDQVRQARSVHVLIVDDNSPDGTGRVVEEMRSTRPWLHVLHRPAKEGLGAAYQAGFSVALEAGAGAVIQMDADHSHPPALLSRMIDSLEHADLVIASRYVAGGTMHIDPWRRVVSGIGNAYLRWALGGDIRDWSTEYKAWRRDLLERVLRRPARGKGYAWLMEMTWAARQAGGRILEIPLQFAVRRAGDSKFSWPILLEDVRLAWALRRSR